MQILDKNHCVNGNCYRCEYCCVTCPDCETILCYDRNDVEYIELHEGYVVCPICSKEIIHIDF